MVVQIKRILVILGIFFSFGLVQNHVSAATATGKIDLDGSVTGVSGSTYYNVNNWQDMFDTYKNVSVSASSNNTVYLNITGDVPGSAAFSGGQGVMISGKSIDIIGNGHTLYVDNDSNYNTGTGRTATGWGFYSNSSAVTSSTNMTVENAKIMNNHADGIFSITGPSTATTIYKNIHTVNGATTSGAGPIRNEQGNIKFLGNNVFNILQGQSQTDLGPGSNLDMSNTETGLSGSDNQGEWIQGGQNIEVVDGETTVNQSWGWDQPFYTYYTKNGSNLSVDDGAKLNWNLNDTYTMYYDDGNTNGPLNWNLGTNSQFIIGGTKYTASHNNNWFMAMNTLNAFNINMASSSLLDISTGGGTINLDGFQGGTSIINMASNSSLSLYNLNSSTSLFSGTAPSGSKIDLNDPKSVLLKTEGGSVFQNGTSIPINIYGAGLRLHASKIAAANQLNDLFKRVVTGTTNGNFTTANMSPINYSTDDLNFLKSAKYIKWYKPNGIGILPSNLNRSFKVSLSNLPKDGSWSSSISGDSIMQMNFIDDRGPTPNFSVQVSQLSNATPNATQYLWQNPDGTTPTTLDNNPTTISTITDDSKLPVNVAMTMAGGNYAFSYGQDSGLLVKANNRLKVQSNQQNATFLYAIVTGP